MPSDSEPVMTKRMKWTVIAACCLVLAAAAQHFDHANVGAALLSLGTMILGKEWTVGSEHRAPAAQGDGPNPRDLR